MLALLISKLHLSYVFKVYIKTLQSLEFILKCSHKYDLVWKKKENVKVLTYALDNIRIILIL